MTSGKKLHSLPGGESYSVNVERVPEGYRVQCESPKLDALVGSGESGSWSVLTGSGSYETRVTRDNGEIRVEVGGERFSFALAAGASGTGITKRTSARAEVKAPMPGKVVKLLVAAGDSVSLGQGIVLFEAMKMQNEIKSPQDGVVSEIFVETGEAVEARDRLFVVENQN